MNPWKSLRGLPRDVWVLFAVTLVNRAGTMVLPFLALYVADELGYGRSTAGAVLTLYGAVALVMGPIAGRLADRFGAVAIMRLSLVGSGIVLVLFPLARSLPWLVAAAAAWAIVAELLRPAGLAVAADAAPPEQRRQAFAVNRLAVNLGMSIGPVAGGFLAEYSYTLLFLVDAASGLAAAVLLWVLPLELRWAAAKDASAEAARHDASAEAARHDASAEAARHDASAEAPPPSAPGTPAGPSWLSDRRLLWLLVATLPVGVVFFQVMAAMPLYLKQDLRMSESTVGMVFAVNTVLIVLTEVPLNAAMASWTHRRSLVLGACLVALGFGALALAVGPVTAGLTVVVWTVGEMIVFPTMSAYISEIAPADQRGRYMGLYTMSFSLAFTVGPWIGTRLLDRLGGPALWLVMLGVGAASAAMLARLREPREAAAG